jgi:hypothetical protein
MAKKNNLARLKRNFPLIKALQNASQKHRKIILKKAKPELIKTIADICYNIANGNIQLPEQRRKKLLRFRKAIRRISDRKTSLKTKRREIVQKGGFIGAIIPALSIAASLISGLLTR